MDAYTVFTSLSIFSMSSNYNISGNNMTNNGNGIDIAGEIDSFSINELLQARIEGLRWQCTSTPTLSVEQNTDGFQKVF